MQNKLIYIDYTNYKGERAIRKITPIKVEFMENEWHKPAQWLLVATDEEKNQERTFAFKNIHSFIDYGK